MKTTKLSSCRFSPKKAQEWIQFLALVLGILIQLLELYQLFSSVFGQ